MTDRSSDDRHLRDAFARLREHDRARAPDAASMLARARAEAAGLAAEHGDAAGRAEIDDLAAARRDRVRGRRLRWGVPGISVALAAGLAAVLLLGPGADDDAQFDRVVQAWAETGGAWRAPTDDLLRMPGDEILRTVPRIGGARPTTPREQPDAPPLDGPGRESPS